jgi:hypothetical protein
MNKPKRKRVVTTLREDLWRDLQVEAAKRGVDANDILEELIARFLPTGAPSKKFPVERVISLSMSSMARDLGDLKKRGKMQAAINKAFEKGGD